MALADACIYSIGDTGTKDNKDSKKKEVERMLDMTVKKKNEIKHMVKILEQIDLPDILLLTRDANTLLMRQKEAEKRSKSVN